MDMIWLKKNFPSYVQQMDILTVTGQPHVFYANAETESIHMAHAALSGSNQHCMALPENTKIVRIVIVSPCVEHMLVA